MKKHVLKFFFKSFEFEMMSELSQIFITDN